MHVIKIYDSLSQNLKPIDDEIITIYNCGPTVYNDIHIGNLRPPVIFDIFVRFLRAINKKVIYVHNITDIDDKIIDRAIQENSDEKTIAQKYTLAYLKVIEKMNLLKPNFQPKVSDNIKNIINYIEQILNNNDAYIQDQNVYFKVNKIKNYGEISKQNITSLIHDIRGANQIEIKNEPSDFALWKKTKKGLSWKAPWGVGRPGWHTECALFINKFIGSQATIHGGGIDLKFPHHENENAQNYSLYNQSLAKIWMHINFINVDNQKMSKSLNNFVLVKNVLKKFSPNALRYFFCLAHYSKPINFSDEILINVEKQINNLFHAIHMARSKLVEFNINLNETLNLKFEPQIILFLCNDLNLPNVITFIEEIKQKLKQAIKINDIKLIKKYLNILLFHLNTFGFTIPNLHTNEVIQLIKEWNILLNEKNYQKADLIRFKLMKLKVL